MREKKAAAQGPWTGRGGFRFSGFGSWMVLLKVATELHKGLQGPESKNRVLVTNKWVRIHALASQLLR